VVIVSRWDITAHEGAITTTLLIGIGALIIGIVLGILYARKVLIEGIRSRLNTAFWEEKAQMKQEIAVLRYAVRRVEDYAENKKRKDKKTSRALFNLIKPAVRKIENEQRSSTPPSHLWSMR